MKKILLSSLFLLVALITVGQSVQVLSFKHYEKIITFDEQRVDAWYVEYSKRDITLLNNANLARSEYLLFKEKIKAGNRYGQFVSVDNLRSFKFTSQFSDLYFAPEGTSSFKKYLDSGVKKKDVRKLMDVRNQLLIGFADAIIAGSNAD